jgi:autotransporter-associated beta strand protein
MNKNIFAGLVTITLLLGLHSTRGGSATWSVDPISSDWNTATNWTPATVPNGPVDTATFLASNTTAIALSANVEVDSLLFDSGASSFTIISLPQLPLTISGTGIINNSGVPQNFIIDQDDSADSNGITFSNNASAGTATVFTVMGGKDFAFGTGGTLIFRNTATAANGTFDVFGAKAHAYRGGSINFWDSSNAGNATIAVHPGGAIDFAQSASLGHATITNDNGLVIFQNDATGGDGTIINSAPLTGGGVFLAACGNVTVINAGASQASSAGYTRISFTADNGTFINNGGDGTGAAGGITDFVGGGANAAQSILIANGGTNGGLGGAITFSESSVGGTARVELFGNGTLDISGHNLAGIAIGSLEGDGQASLGANPLTIGGSNLSTIFSGLIQGTGQIIKNGKGTLSLSSANTYTGGTTLTRGTLRVSNISGSATGSGSVQVDGGILGGTGIIAGETSIGLGTTAPAILKPSAGGKKPATLTIQSALHFKGGAFDYQVDTRKAQGDQVVANGVSIENQDAFNFATVSNRKLPVGQVFIAISNTAATPISGTFGNLPDGATFRAGKNTFQANYEGGDGNDLTLTVIP